MPVNRAKRWWLHGRPTFKLRRLDGMLLFDAPKEVDQPNHAKSARQRWVLVGAHEWWRRATERHREGGRERERERERERDGAMKMEERKAHRSIFNLSDTTAGMFSVTSGRGGFSASLGRAGAAKGECSFSFAGAEPPSAATIFGGMLHCFTFTPGRPQALDYN